MQLNPTNPHRFQHSQRRQPLDTHTNTQKPGAYLVTQSPILQQEIAPPIQLKNNTKSAHQKTLNRCGSDISNMSDLKNVGDWVHFGIHYGEAKAEKYEKKSTSILASKPENIAIAADARKFSQAMIQVSTALSEGQPFLAKEAMSKFMITDIAMTIKLNNPKLPVKHQEMLYEINSICIALTDAIDDAHQKDTLTRDFYQQGLSISSAHGIEEKDEDNYPLATKKIDRTDEDSKYSDDDMSMSDLTENRSDISDY